MKIGNWFYLRYNANDLNGINLLNGINEKDLRKNISILVIDDSDFPLQEPLETIGFKFTKKSGNEESFCINDYAEYDIILCDISGVGMKLNSKFQGAFLANEIKKAYPNKMVPQNGLDAASNFLRQCSVGFLDFMEFSLVEVNLLQASFMFEKCRQDGA